MSQRSILDSQLAHARETADAAAEALCLMQWAELAQDEDNDEEALGGSRYNLSQGFYAQAAEIFARAGDVDGQIEALTALADRLATVDDPLMERLAHLLYEDIFLLYARLHNAHAQALVLTKIPHVIWRLDEQVREAFYERVLTFLEQFADPIEKADFLVLLAETMVGWPHYQEDVATFEKALRLYEMAHDVSRQARVIRRLGELMLDETQAYAYLQQAAALHESVGDFSSAGDIWQAIGRTAEHYSRFVIAPEEAYLRAAGLFKRAGNIFFQGLALEAYGSMRPHPNPPDARDKLERALSIFEQGEDVSHQIKTLERLAAIHEMLKDIEQVRRCYQQALRLMIKVQDRAWLLWAWGLTEHHIGAREQALQRFQQAIDEHQQLNADFTPSIIADWQDELRQMGYLSTANYEEDHHDD
jgi:tetratricopeptide (TPR) repeat protein